MARRRNQGRAVNDILLLNKPIGISSNTALQKAKRIFNAAKAGHTGSLDNLATGLLPICFGEATKISGFLLDANKRYRAECILGQTTTTADAEGEIVATFPTEHITQALLETTLQQFIGDSEQIPPMYSALKKEGQPLYKLARQGQTVERAARNITIYDIKLLNFTATKFTIEVSCSKGTYIRTLAEDIGKSLNSGAYIGALHRIGVGQFNDMYDFASLEEKAMQGFETLDNILIPMHIALSHWQSVTLDNDKAYYLKQGQKIHITDVPTAELVTLFENEQFIGIGKVLEDGRIAPKRLLRME